MSTWSRLALVAVGAAFGAVATRLASSETGSKALAARTEVLRSHGKDLVSPLRSSHMHPADTWRTRENKLATRMLRVVQDVRAAMDQRESELRQQLGMPSPGDVRRRETHRRSIDGEKPLPNSYHLS